MSRQAQDKVKKDFYERNPEFVHYRDIVQATVQEVEIKCPGKDYGYILSIAEPMIRNRVIKAKELEKLPMDEPEVFNSDGKGII